MITKDKYKKLPQSIPELYIMLIRQQQWFYYFIAFVLLAIAGFSINNTQKIKECQMRIEDLQVGKASVISHDFLVRTIWWHIGKEHRMIDTNNHYLPWYWEALDQANKQAEKACVERGNEFNPIIK